MMRRETSVSWLAPYSTLAKRSGFVDQRAEQVGFEIGKLALQDACQTLQARAGINRGLGQRRHDPLLVAIELHEDEIPQLHVTAAVAGELAIGVPRSLAAVPMS